MTIEAAGFLSYVNDDDFYGHISELRERLSHEIKVQSGKPFPIFQDRNDIQWGQNWAQRLEQALGEEITFLIPIITPSFFNSSACRKELTLFLEREQKLGRNDLILPIYYVECPIFSDADALGKDLLAQAIASRQRADWRDLRFEPFNSPQVGRTLATLGTQIVKAIARLT